MSATGTLTIRFIRRALNILISRGGDGNLLYELHTIQAETREAKNSTLLLPFVLISVIVIIIIRYTLGHTLVHLLTLESVFTRNYPYKDEDKSVRISARDRPLYRHVFSSLRTLHESHGLGIFAKGIKPAVIYQLSKTLLISIFTATFLRSASIQPIADFLSTLLLMELHMDWTHATISSDKTIRKYRLWTFDARICRILLLPCAVHGGAVLLLNWVSTYVLNLSEDIDGNVPSRLSEIAILRVAIALAVRTFVLAPTTAWLTLAEASHLPSGQDTLVYNDGKQRFLTIGELQLRSFGDPWKGISGRLSLGLLELHLKKCAVHILLEGCLVAIVHILA